MLKPHWDFFTAFISLHYYFNPEGQFERNVGQNSQNWLSLVFTASQETIWTTLVHFEDSTKIALHHDFGNFRNVIIMFELLENQKFLRLESFSFDNYSNYKSKQ